MTKTEQIASEIRADYAEIVDITGDADVQVLWIREGTRASRYQRAEVDQALVLLSCEGDVRIYPQSNQKCLSESERGAAVWIGNQAKHLMQIAA